MQSKGTIVTIIVLVLSILPAAGATWSVAGNSEPNTEYDTATWMWQDAPGLAKNRIYFNVVTQGSVPRAGGSYNPNVAALETRNEAATGEYHEALLGEWVDCNGDGYVGNLETALREYPSELLSSTAICPPTSGSINNWNYARGHNYNGIVSELIPVARDPDISPLTGEVAAPRDTRRLVDDTARVWGDFDRPDMAQETRRCALHPLPRGTTKDTGGALSYLDCRADVLENFNAAMDAAGDPAGLRFADAEDASSGALGRVTLFGADSTEHAAATTADCGADPVVRSGDVLNETPAGPATQDQDGGGALHEVYVYQASPSVNMEPETWTVPGQVNATSEETGDCDTSNDAGQDFYGNWESDNPQIDPKNKKGANWNFYYSTSNRGGAPVSFLNVPRPGSGGSAGLDENDAGVGWGGSRWISDSLWGSKLGPRLVKADLDSQQVGIADAYYLTFFAYVGTNITTTSVLPGGGPTAAYGATQCAGLTSGIRMGWNCDARTWYKNPDGSEQTGFAELERHELVLLGQPYNLRDVDCYDGSNNVGVPLGAAALGDSPCQ